MGGKAAKERRRLQRLAVQPSNNDKRTKNDQNETTTTAKQPQKKEQKRFDNTKSASIPSSRVVPPRHTHDGRRFTTANNRARFTKDHFHSKKGVAPPKQKQGAPKDQKFKKPKHLKRKIEKLSEEDEQQERKRALLQELNQWEEKKLAPKHCKKQKTTHSPSPAPKQTKEPKKTTTTLQPVNTQFNVEGATLQEANDNENQSRPNEEPKRTDTTIPQPDGTQSDLKNEEATTKTTNPVVVSDEKNPLVVEEEEESSSDSDSNVSLEDTTKRQRGRRRRGRQSTEQHTQELDETKEQAPIIINVDLKETEPPLVENQLDNESDTIDVKKTLTKKDGSKRRWCIGRKPVTDFLMGQRYPGKVIYTKPFGAFIDIGCHSDAFCHVSRVRDDFVKSIDDALRIGDEVSARVVEVDRSGKRITVSLQSDARIKDERTSVEARMQRTKKMKKSKHHHEHVVKNTSPSVAKREAPIVEEPLDESMMTPTEIKRARKLARRVARREQQVETGIAAKDIAPFMNI
jgi:predicted RNA-binding protein with RPS1 domain